MLVKALDQSTSANTALSLVQQGHVIQILVSDWTMCEIVVSYWTAIVHVMLCGSGWLISCSEIKNFSQLNGVLAVLLRNS